MTARAGRTAQKERTRQAILDGARALMQEGQPVTVAAAAERHGISKATAYRYFSDAAVLAAEAGLDIAVAGYEEITAGAADLRGKLRAISLYFFDLSLAHEVQFRQFVGMALLASATAPGAPRRGGRRLEMYRRALSERESGLDATGQARLVNALAATTGAEAMIALLDVAGAGAQEARLTVAEVTEAILDRHLGVPGRTAA